jgi:hypothetical protein
MYRLFKATIYLLGSLRAENEIGKMKFQLVRSQKRESLVIYYTNSEKGKKKKRNEMSKMRCIICNV